MGRRVAREEAMKLLFQLEIQKSDRADQIKNTVEGLNFNENDVKYITEIVNGVFPKIEEIDNHIKFHAKGWTVERLSKVDLAILRISVYEILYRDDIPVSVSVNEAVELAKKYSGDDAAPFINGLLGKFTKHIESKKE
jgi:transcription antitermination protein NusB